MSNLAHAEFPRQGRRPHFVKEWAEKRGLKQADIARDIGVDKSLVSRWFDEDRPATPSAEWQAALAEYFGTTPDSLFRHPDEEWITRFFAGRGREEIERMKATLEAAFPRRQDRDSPPARQPGSTNRG